MGRELDMIVVRYSNDGQLCQSRPCYHCLRTLTNSNIRIKNVYYSVKDGICKEKFSEMFASDLTSVSSGMRRRNRNEKCCNHSH